MKAAASNINIKIYQQFSKLRVLGIRMTIVQQKISGDLHEYIDHTCENIHKINLNLFK